MQAEEEMELIDLPNVMETHGKEEVLEVLEEVMCENKILQKEVEEKEKEMKSVILLDSNEEDDERKTKQLMFLLTRTHFYATHLAERIKTPCSEETKESAADEATHAQGTSCGITKGRYTNRKKTTIGKQFDQKMIEKCIQKMEKDDVHGVIVEDASIEKDPLSNSIHSGQMAFFEGPNLKEYQVKGVQWLKSLYENAVNGILADEMGLGKTVQVIALICHLLSKKVNGPFLVIAPLSTVLSWINEFQKFAPKVPTVLFHGNSQKRSELRNTFVKKLCGDINMYPVIITTYEIALSEKQFFLLYKWEYIIVDEAQRLKNYRCHLSRFLRETTSKNRLLLTGTPLQNNLTELWALLNFLIPEVFNDLAVFEQWLSADELRESNAIVQKEAQCRIVSKMHQILSPFILRRMKSDVEMNLPPKKEVLIYAPMTKKQWELYTSTISGEINYYLGKDVKDSTPLPKKRHCTNKVNYVDVDSDDDCNDDTHSAPVALNINKNTKLYKDEDGNLCRIYLKMQNPAFQLRKISNHPYLVQMPVDSELKGMLIDENIVKKSGKMLILDLLLPRLKALNHKVLLFSTMTMLLDLIEEYVILRNYNYVRLDGTISLQDRSCSINEFTYNPNVFLFLISTRAGGLGLNLTTADTVIIFDSDWNPQVDQQAQDRCHRIGQTKPVVVYRLITHGTIDEKIVSYAARKRKLEKLILHKDLDKTNDLSKMERTITLQELKSLLDSRDYAKVVHTSGSILSDEELDEILDRRECTFQ